MLLLAASLFFGLLLLAEGLFFGLLTLFLVAGLLVLLRHGVELDARLHLQLALDGIGAGEAERAEHVDALALDIDLADGLGTVALNGGVQVAHPHLLPAYLVDIGSDDANGQLAALLPAHLGRARLGDVVAEVGLTDDAPEVGHVEGTAKLQIGRTGLAEEILVGIVDGEIEVERSQLSMQVATELLLAPQYVEAARIANVAQGMQLFHHELLHRKLVDDGLGRAALGRHSGHIEVDGHTVFVAEMPDMPTRSDLQPAVGSAHADVAEVHACGITAQRALQPQGNRELAEHGGKGLGNVLEHHTTGDIRDFVGQLALLFLAGQRQVGTTELQGGAAKLDDDLRQTGLALVGGNLHLHIVQTDTRLLVGGFQMLQARHEGILVDIVYLQPATGGDVQMAVVESTASGLALVLSRQTVVVGKVQAAEVNSTLPVFLLQRQTGETCHALLHALLRRSLEARLQPLHRAVVTAKEGLRETQTGQRGMTVIIGKADIVDLQVRDVELQLLLLLLGPCGGRQGVGHRLFLPEGIDDKLIVGHRVGRRLIEMGMEPPDGGRRHAHLLAQQGHPLKADGEQVETQHLALLAVLDADTAQQDALREEAHADTVDAHRRLQLLAKQTGGIAHQPVLKRTGVKDKGEHHQQCNNSCHHDGQVFQ